MTDLLRAQLTLQHRNALPRDAVSMNYWFASDDANEANAALVAARVRDVLKVAIAPRPNPLARFLGNTVGDTGHTVKVYDYDMVTGERLSYSEAPPIHTLGFTLTGIVRNTTDTLPSEVALVLSTKANAGATPGGGTFATPLAQRRGRVFFGPIQPASEIDEATTHISRPDATLIDYLLAAHFGLMGTGTANDWVVYSRPFEGRAAVTAEARKAAGGPLKALPALPARPGQAYIIDQVSCDNAWDTQRRRGERATARTVL